MTICDKKLLLFLGVIWTFMIVAKLMTSPIALVDILVNGVVAFSNVVLVYSLAKRLFPKNEEIPKLASVIFMGCPLFFMYIGETVSGFLSSACILLSVLLILNAVQTGRYRYFLCLGTGVAVGCITHNIWTMPLIEERLPLWFYALILLFSFWPLLLWPHAWRSITGAYKRKTEEYGFLILWSVVSSFGVVVLSCGQELFDIIPVLPMFSLLWARLISSQQAEDKDMLTPFGAGILLFILLGVSSMFNNLFVTMLLGVFILSALILREFCQNKALAQVSLFLVMNGLFVFLLS